MKKGFAATFRKRGEAKQWAQVTEADLLAGRHYASRNTLADLIDRYIADILPRKSRNTISAQTHQLMWWRERLGHRLLSDITHVDIMAERDRLQQSGRRDSTVRRYMSALGHAFSIAVREWGWLEDSPMRRVTRPPEPRGRVRYLSDNERERLLAVCEASDSPFLNAVVVLALSTGARKMELMELTWTDVDLRRGIIRLRETKNGEPRVLPLIGRALDLMQEHSAKRRRGCDLVFPNCSGIKPRSLRTAWETALRRARIDDFCFHDLRHSAASYLAMGGASLAEIAEVLGHKDIRVARRYVHLNDAHTQRVVERMNQAIFG